MGCDIHILVQQKCSDRWHSTGYRVFDGRHYDLFAMLANVRNQGNIIPISEPRGFPKDMEEYAKTMYDLDGADHSHSWLLLTELLPENEYWDNYFTKTVIVEEAVYKKWKESDVLLPESWCQAVSGGNVITVEEADYHERIAGDVYIRCHINMSYRVIVENFLKISVRMLMLIADGKPENVRIVFGFDS